LAIRWRRQDLPEIRLALEAVGTGEEAALVVTVDQNKV
jgi:hypothetical protein